MSIKISEALKLRYLNSFQLIAGEWGLNNSIDKIGILDHEIVEDIRGEFGQGDFVLSSFTPARNDLPLLIKSIEDLIDSKVSGLAIKNIFFKELPKYIIDLANSKHFPIFIFDENIYYEDIIAEVNEKIRLKDDDSLLMAKIDILLKGEISKNIVRTLALEINHAFKDNFIIGFCKENKYLNDKNITKLIDLYKFQVQTSPHKEVIKYRDGILIICSKDNKNTNHLSNDLKNIIRNLGITLDNFTVGISDIHKSLDYFSKGLNQAFQAVKSSGNNKSDFIYYADIGIHKILLPFIENDYIRDYSKEIIDKLNAYDLKHHTDLYKTAIVYINNDQNIKTTAKDLYQHENTIRYRIKKIKEVLHMEHLQGSFNEQLSIAVKIHLLINH
jgi:hypothetical protein